MIFNGEEAASILKELKENYLKNCDDKKHIEALDYAIGSLDNEENRRIDYLCVKASSRGLRPCRCSDGWFGYFHKLKGEYAFIERINGYIVRVKATDISFID